MVVGPLQVFDEVTLSLVRHAMQAAVQYVGDKPDYAPGVALLEKLVDEHGRHGRAAGKGFYDYEGGKRRGFWSGLKELTPPAPEASGADLLGKRMLLMQCVEAVQCVEEGVIKLPRDAEVGGIFGIGFAPNTGGPLSYLDRMGLTEAVNLLEQFALKYGARYTPPALLKKMAAAGETFFEKV